MSLIAHITSSIQKLWNNCSKFKALFPVINMNTDANNTLHAVLPDTHPSISF